MYPHPVLIVGIGASPSALGPLRTLLQGMPANPGIAFVIVQPVEVGGESSLASTLRELTALEVVDAVEGMPVLADRIHIIPAAVRMGIDNLRLSVLVEDQCHNLQLPIDHFLCSLAADQGERAVGILLSGPGMDGTQGLADIKGAGGITLVQDPRTTAEAGMIRSAMEAARVDAVLAVERMPLYLLELVERLASLSDKRRQEEEINGVLLAVRAATGHDFHCYKRNTLIRRMHRRMALLHIDDYRAYARHLRMESGEATLLRGDLLIGVTEFFRQPKAWQVLEKEVIPQLVERADAHSTLRVWVPACANGKEAYSLAMLLVEGVEACGKKLGIQLFATDPDERALDVARLGIYTEDELASISPARRSRFFVRKNDHFQVVKPLRELMAFAPQNLTSDPPFSRLDLISCRNLLIYLDQSVQRRILSMFHFALRDGGFLFLGGAESVNGQEELFAPISKQWRIYRRIGIGRPARLEFPLRQIEPKSLFPGIATPLVRPTTLTTVAQHALLTRFAPPSVIVNGKGQLFYAHGNVEEYLRVAPGEHSGSVIDMAREGLRLRLRSAITRCAEDGCGTTVMARVKRGESSVAVKVTVSRLRYPREAEGLLLVCFEDQLAIPAVSAGAEPPEGELQQLDDELKITREELQSLIEQFEQSNEHLKASHEEVTAANEELQTSNEELETSKEELQSLNEELNAVNVCLEEKVEELGRTNNDVLNLLASTDIATLFLDRDFRIRRFTPAVTKLFTLIPGDTGRSIEDISRRFADEALLDDARRVLRDLSPASVEVRTVDGTWYIRRIMPYRTQDDRIEGVVITFVDVNEIKRSQAELELSRHAAEQATEAIKVLARFPSENPSPVLRVAADGALLYANPAAMKLQQWGLELGGPVPAELGHLADEALSQGAVSAELSVDGRVFWLDVTPIRGELYVNIYGRDITDRQAVAEALREREAHLQSVLENVGEGIIVSDLEGKLLHWNRAALAMHECATLEECRRRLPEFVDTFELSSLDGTVLTVEEWPMSRILRGEHLRNVECNIRRIQGGWQRVYNYGGSLVRDEQGQPLLAILTVSDISERKRSEEALRASEERLNRAQEIAHLGSWELDLVNNQLLWSDEVYHIFGLRRPEFAATYESFLDCVHPDDRVSVHEAYNASIRSGLDTYEIEHRIVRRDNGEIRIVHEKCEHFRDPAGGIMRSVGMIHDITERKQAEENLRRLNAELEDRVQQRTADLQRRAQQLSLLASELTLAEQRERRRLAQVLHDHLQQLLVGAKFGLEVVARRVDEKQRAAISQVQGLLAESITASRSLTVELSPPILHEGGLGAGLEWLVRWMREKHGLQVELLLDKEAGTDREDLRVLLFQSTRELLFNIVKHAGVTRARVEVTLRDAQLRVEVSDEGVGFAPEMVWDSSRQMTAGFGLFSIRERLGLMGGRMEIDSGPNLGTRVVLEAPVAQTRGDRQETLLELARDLQGSMEESAPPAAASVPGRKIRVMLVDDHGVMRQGLAAILSDERDIDIVGQACDGQEAVEMAPRLLPDVILMDFSMPRMDGVEATRRIHAELPSIRIVGLSMYEEADRAATMIEAGASAYVTKSGRSEILLAAIRNTA